MPPAFVYRPARRSSDTMFGFGKKAKPSSVRETQPPDDAPYSPPVRALESASFVEITDRINQLGAPLRAAAYVFGERILVVRSIGCGLNVEVDEPVVLSISDDDEVIGRALCDQLLAFRRGPLPDVRERKQTDWPAYRASGAKSVMQFEATGHRVALGTVGDSIRLEAAPMTSLHGSMAVAAVSRPDHEGLGALFRRTLLGAACLREAGVI